MMRAHAATISAVGRRAKKAGVPNAVLLHAKIIAIRAMVEGQSRTAAFAAAVKYIEEMK